MLLNVPFDIKWMSVQELIVGNDMVVFSTGLPVCSVQGCLIWLRWKILDEFAQAFTQYISHELLILWTRIILTDVTTLKTARVWHVLLPLIALFMLSFRLWSCPLQQDVGWDLLLSTKTAGGKKNTLSSSLTVFAYPIYGTAYCKRWTASRLNSCWKRNHGRASFQSAGCLHWKPTQCTLLSVVRLIKKKNKQGGRFFTTGLAIALSIPLPLSLPWGHTAFSSAWAGLFWCPWPSSYESLTAVYECVHVHVCGGEKIVVRSREGRCTLSWALFTGKGCIIVYVCACWCAVHVCLIGFVCFVFALSKLACLCADYLSETMRSALHWLFMDGCGWNVGGFPCNVFLELCAQGFLWHREGRLVFQF